MNNHIAPFDRSEAAAELLIDISFSDTFFPQMAENISIYP